MIENYKKDKNGVIHQINVDKISYNPNYINNSYNKYGDLTTKISHLRLGYIIGSIGRYPESILDIGYGNGDFLSLCSENIKECYGNDISNYTIPDKCLFINDIFSKYFDVITFFDSLEHFDDIDFIYKLNCNYIVISLPWCHNISDEWFLNWKHLRINEHLHHFDDKSLINYMKVNGYENINISSFEDVIRKPIDNNFNILSGVFKKIK